MSKQKGFGSVAILSVILVIAILAFASWKIYSANQHPDAKDNTQSNTISTKTKSSSETKQVVDDKPVIPDDWQLYKDDKYGYSFAYPKSWGALHDEAFPGGGYDASKDWLVHKVTDKVQDEAIGLFYTFGLDVVTKNYQEFRVNKAGTPLVYSNEGGSEHWVASSTVDVENDNYKQGDTYDVPVAKTLNGTKIFKIYGNYEEVVSAAWRFAVRDGIVTINMPAFASRNYMTGEKIGDEETFSKLTNDILNTIQID